MLMVVLLTVVLVACVVDVDNHNIKGTTDVTIKLDKEYAGLEVYSASADIEIVSSTEYKFTKDDANVFDVVIQCTNYDTKYITFTTLELVTAVVVDVVMESTTYIAEINVTGIEDEDIENVVIKADDKIVEYEYNAEDKKFILTSKVQYSTILVECEGYNTVPVEISYFYNVAKANVNALNKADGLAFIKIVNNTSERINIKCATMGNDRDYTDIPLYSNESTSMVVDISDYMISDFYNRVISQYVYRSDLEDGYEEIVFNEIVRPRFVLDLLGEDVNRVYINSNQIGRYSVDGESDGDFIVFEDFSVGEELVVSIVPAYGDSINYKYTVTEEDIANGTLAITSEAADVVPCLSATINYVDENGNAITDDSLLVGLGLKLDQKVINPVDGVITYTKENVNSIRFDNYYNDYYVSDNIDYLGFINDSLSVGKSSIDIELREIMDVNVKFVYKDLEDKLQTYDEGLKYNTDKNITEDSDLGYNGGKFLDANTFSYSFVYGGVDRSIGLTRDFNISPDNDYYQTITLPTCVDGMKYDEVSDTYLVEILVYKYYDVNIYFNYVGIVVNEGTIMVRDSDLIFDASSVHSTVRLSSEFLNYPSSFPLIFCANNTPTQENVGFLHLTSAMYKQQLIDGQPIFIDINIRETDSGHDDF